MRFCVFCMFLPYYFSKKRVWGVIHGNLLDLCMRFSVFYRLFTFDKKVDSQCHSLIILNIIYIYWRIYYIYFVGYLSLYVLRRVPDVTPEFCLECVVRFLCILSVIFHRF